MKFPRINRIIISLVVCNSVYAQDLQNEKNSQEIKNQTTYAKKFQFNNKQLLNSRYVVKCEKDNFAVNEKIGYQIIGDGVKEKYIDYTNVDLIKLKHFKFVNKTKSYKFLNQDSQNNFVQIYVEDDEVRVYIKNKKSDISFQVCKLIKYKTKPSLDEIIN